MSINLEALIKALLAVLTFPLLFQKDLIIYIWQNGSEEWITWLKRLFLLLPTLAVIAALWITIASTITILFRKNRAEFVSAIFVTWWDLGRGILQFWAGILSFVWLALGAFALSLRMLFVLLTLSIKDMLVLPYRLIRDLGSSYHNPGIPWLAVMMMIGWSLLEALIFTFVMSPLVLDVLSGLADVEPSGMMLKVPLFLMFFIFVLGSYAVLGHVGDALKERSAKKIASFFAVETIVALVEVVFLYREFVDALVPWFAQHAGGDFHLGLFGVLGIAFIAWLGIRAMTWFLFGRSSVPVILAILERTPLKSEGGGSGFTLFDRKKSERGHLIFAYTQNAMSEIRNHDTWLQQKRDELVSALVLPPLQVLAALVNFCTLLVSGTHMFEIPFKSYHDVLETRALMMNTKKPLLDDKK